MLPTKKTPDAKKVIEQNGVKSELVICTGK